MPTKLPANMRPNYKMGKKKTDEEVLREGFKEVKQPGLSAYPTGQAPAPVIGSKGKTTGTSNTGVARGRGTVSGASNSARNPIDKSRIGRDSSRGNDQTGSATYSRSGQKTGQSRGGNSLPAGIKDMKHEEPKSDKPKGYIKLEKKKSSYIKLPKKGG